MLRLTTDYVSVGQYTGGGDARKYVIHIDLIDAGTGAVLQSTDLYGGEPPQRVKRSIVDFDDNRYGDKPSDEKITAACLSLIGKQELEE